MTTYYHYTTKKFLADLEEEDAKQIIKPEASPLGFGVYFTTEGPDGKYLDMLKKMYGEEGRGKDKLNKKCIMYFAFNKKQVPGLKRKTKGIFATLDPIQLTGTEYTVGCADEYADP